MLPSRTVENYLKAIYKAQAALPKEQALVPMGHLATALGVVPGTTTTMVRALAESGLVVYEPYAGVRLTPAGKKLAVAVLRRHRLIELFLVNVMGMSWAEVHDEAEQLEHAVSDRLIERMDDLLGHPSADPHGDPIPDATGTVERHSYHTLLTCPPHTPVMVTRVLDQDAGFLHFLEQNDLKPGQTIEVDAREDASDSVRVRRQDDRRITIGMRAASKLLVEVIGALLFLLLPGTDIRAQTRAAEAPTRPFEILDNSFLVEEAFNQEAGIFQNIFGFIRVNREWELSFTQEWPIRTQRHQVSYTIPVVGHSGEAGVGDLLINYRYQLLVEGPGRPAFAPRFSLVLPAGDAELEPVAPASLQTEAGFGNGSFGLQVNLPFSKQVGDLYLHWNAGLTYLPTADTPRDVRPPGLRQPPDLDGAPVEVALFLGRLAASGIWRVRPMVNLMLEALLELDEPPVAPGRTARATVVTLAPAIRGGWNVGDRQIITGLAVPVSFQDGAAHAGLLAYFSYELPFKK